MIMRKTDKLFCWSVDNLHALAKVLGTNYNTLNVVLAGVAIISVMLNLIFLLTLI